jgi:hypothetical protein
MWNLVLVHLDIVLVSLQDRCPVYAKRTIGLEIIWTDSMVLLGDVAQVEARFSPFGESANLIGVRFEWNIPQAQKSFWTHLM